MKNDSDRYTVFSQYILESGIKVLPKQEWVTTFNSSSGNDSLDNLGKITSTLFCGFVVVNGDNNHLPLNS